MDKIKIETNGIILNGKLRNWKIFIQDLNIGKGAYLILLKSADGSKTFDDWVENLDALHKYFNEAEWEVVWSKF